MTDFASPVFSVAEKIIHSRALRQCLQHKEFPECQNEVKRDFSPIFRIFSHVQDLTTFGKLSNLGMLFSGNRLTVFSDHPRPVLPQAAPEDTGTIYGFSYVPDPAAVFGCGAEWAEQFP